MRTTAHTKHRQKAATMNTTETDTARRHADTIAEQIAQTITTLEQLAATLENNPTETAQQLETYRTYKTNNTGATLPRQVSYIVRAVNIYAERIAATDEADLSIYYEATTPRTETPLTGRVTFRLRHGQQIYVSDRSAPTYWNGNKFTPLSPGALAAIEKNIELKIVDKVTNKNNPATVANLIQDAHTEARRNRATSALAQARYKLDDLARGIDR